MNIHHNHVYLNEVHNLGRISQFKYIEVVNMRDGRRLGFVNDADVNFKTGQLEAIIITGSGKIFSFFKKTQEIIIPFDRIRKIGDDVIIVDIEERILRSFLK